MGAPAYGRRVTSTVPFAYLRHALTVPVRVAGAETRFILDTGAGLNMVSGEGST